MGKLFPDSVYAPRKGETKEKAEARLWEPLRRGALYCAPRCGLGCTWAEYQLAKTRANALCKRLGKGWAPRVWENLGWHYAVFKGAAVNGSGTGLIDLHASHYGNTAHYTIFLQLERQLVLHGSSPEKLLKQLQKDARKLALKLNAAASLAASI